MSKKAIIIRGALTISILACLALSLYLLAPARTADWWEPVVVDNSGPVAEFGAVLWRTGEAMWVPAVAGRLRVSKEDLQGVSHCWFISGSRFSEFITLAEPLPQRVVVRSSLPWDVSSLTRR